MLPRITLTYHLILISMKLKICKIVARAHFCLGPLFFAVVFGAAAAAVLVVAVVVIDVAVVVLVV